MTRTRVAITRLVGSLAVIGGVTLVSLVPSQTGTSPAAQQNPSPPEPGTSAQPADPVRSVVPSGQRLRFLTKDWKGDRYPGGRPRVSDDVLERMKNVSIEQAWGTLREHGYHNQFAGKWKTIHPDRPVIGRVLTAQYMPSSPGLEERLTDAGHEAGREGQMNTWPIKMLNNGDVYVADGYGKIKDGTLIGGNLGTEVQQRSGNGVVFNGSVRDLGELEKIGGFNAFVRGWHPSYIQEMMLTGINVPIRIGEATAMPGDVVLARREGVLFIPAHLAADVVNEAEENLVRDRFIKQRLEEGTYTSGQVDKDWDEVAPEIKQDYRGWLQKNKDDLPVPPDRVQEIIDTM